MSDGKCLVPTPPAPVGLQDTVIALDCGTANKEDTQWMYNRSGEGGGGLIVHVKSGLCLDAGSPFELNCWSPSSPTCVTRFSISQHMVATVGNT